MGGCVLRKICREGVWLAIRQAEAASQAHRLKRRVLPVHVWTVNDPDDGSR